MSIRSSLDIFGQGLVQWVIDPVLALFRDSLKRSVSTECGEQEIDRLLSKLDVQDVAVLQKIIRAAVVKTTHYLLWQAEQEKITILQNGQDIAKLSDGLSGELYLDDGWLERYSQHH